MMSEIDVLPTLVKLAGGELPKDKVIDGKDIWPLLSGKSRESPHEELFFFTGIRLDGVRSGQWKLLVVRQGDGKTRAPKKKTAPQPPYVPELFNLDADIGETTDVALQNPDVVKRLQELIAKMDADLGTKNIGPGVRPCGVVKDPKPLLMDPREYK
jgi:arylsulfatase A-like enzyme